MYQLSNSYLDLSRFRFPALKLELIGNRVRIPDRPAAVFSTTFTYKATVRAAHGKAG